MKSCDSMVLILSDQLDLQLSSLASVSRESSIIVLMEVEEFVTNVPHHPKKIAFLYSAMRHFAKELEKKGFAVSYITMEAKENKQKLFSNLKVLTQKYKPQSLIVTEPSEYHLLKEVKSWEGKLSCGLQIKEDTRFFCSHTMFREFAKGKKRLLMEHFYRMMRKNTGYLLDQEGKPEGGKWNFDCENRNRYDGSVGVVGPKKFRPDSLTKSVIDQVKKRYSSHFGQCEPFWFGVTHLQAKKSLQHFIEHSLPHFGTFQDAMANEEHFLFHSVLSQYLNSGLLSPRFVCEKVLEAYEKNRAPLNAVEGFIRQVIGWREYVRGLYWYLMPRYKEKNFFKAKQPLPSFYWTGDIKMQCMKQVIKQTESEAHSHHIQRLMVTGNFAMLAGVNPKEVCEWYLAVYADAFEWVELPNTLSMALYADGGVLSTKPYAASGNYINKMSNFCKKCPYDVKKRSGDNACPFNFLYWDFLDRNHSLLKENQRLRFAYSNLKKIPSEELKKIRVQAKKILKEEL